MAIEMERTDHNRKVDFIAKGFDGSYICEYDEIYFLIVSFVYTYMHRNIIGLKTLVQ